MGKNIETTVVLSDMHIPEHNVKAIRCAEKIIADIKPDRLVYLGDILDLAVLSHWNKDKRRVVEGKRLINDYEVANKVIDSNIKACGKNLKEIVYIEGNHEKWIEDYLDSSPEIEGMIELKQGLKMDARKMTLVPLNRFYRIGKLYLTHGAQSKVDRAIHHAKAMVDLAGRSVMFGHHHSSQQFVKVGIVDDTDRHIAISIPGLCNLNPEWRHNDPSSWMHGFAIIYTLPNGNFNHYVVNIINGKAVFNGKVYEG